MAPTVLPDHPFRPSELYPQGISRHHLRQLLTAGVVRRPFTGVYVPARLPDSIEVRARCAARVLPPHVVVCDRSAAWLWGVDRFDLAELHGVPDLEVVSRTGHSRTKTGGTFGGERDLLDDEITEIHGIRVTTPLRTACDLGRLWGRYGALAALDAFMRHHDLTRADFTHVLPRFRGRRGVIQLRTLVALATPKSESPGESWTRGLIIDDGLPAPEPQVWVRRGGRDRYRLDLAYRLLKIVVEYNGEEFHGPERQEADEARREWLRRQGWHVIVVVKEDLIGARRDAWLQELRAVHRERSTRAKRRYAVGPGSGRRAH